jgi:hypothetical protein
MGLKTNIIDRKPAIISNDVVEVWQESDFGTVNPGVSIEAKAGTTFKLMAPITQTLPLIIGTGDSIQIVTTNRSLNTLTYTHTTEEQFQGTNIGTLALFDISMNGNNTGSIFNINGGVISAKFPDFNRYADAGTVQNLTDFYAPGIFFDVISGGLAMINCASSTFAQCLILGLDGNTFTFFNISGASSGDIQIYDNIMENDAQSSFVSVDNATFPADKTVSLIANNIVNNPENFFGPGSITETDNRVILSGNKGVSDSVVSIEANLFNNALTTDIPATGALVFISATTWTSEEASRITVTAVGGVAEYTGLIDTTMKKDGNVYLEPSSSTKTLSSRFILEKAATRTVTFTNGTNTVNDTATPLVNGDLITFRRAAGTLPSELRKDIVYYVVNKLTDSFQVSYTSGGAAVAFTDDGTPTNSYAICETHGSVPRNSIAANNPRELVPQALETMQSGDFSHIVISNESDSVNILVTNSFYRMFD